MMVQYEVEYDVIPDSTRVMADVLYVLAILGLLHVFHLINGISYATMDSCYCSYVTTSNTHDPSVLVMVPMSEGCPPTVKRQPAMIILYRYLPEGASQSCSILSHTCRSPPAP